MLAHRAAAGVVALVVGSASTADAARSKPKPSDEAGCTAKLQELDVSVNSQVQAGSKRFVNEDQIARIAALRALNPLATPIVSVDASTLKLGVLPMLAAGLEHARLMGPPTTRR
ncbi:hypothetical protein M885DRAFT_581409 [Pelagophyceae sp. CCMP2097]|nr:hypothetical protein M885DRAFT_581409 [Pelagophyceae sp. CCMP2097]